MKEASAMNLTPYRKTVLSAVGTVIAVAINVALGNDTTASLSTAIVGLITTIGVFSVSNVPADKTNLAEPSSHEVSTSLLPASKRTTPASVASVVALTQNNRKPRATSKAVSKKTASKAKKVTERRPTSKKAE